MTYFRELDGIRAIAALSVLAFHLGLMPFGWMGVPVFFVLSGYLITRSLMRRPTVGQFLTSRARRLFPLLALYLTVNAALAFASGVSLDGYGWFVAGLGNYHIGTHDGAAPGGAVAHLWSLAVELQFYLLWPLAVFLVPRVWPVALAAILVAPVARAFILHTTANPYMALVSLPSCLDALGAGALIAAVRSPRTLALMGATGVALVALSLRGLSWDHLGTTTTFMPQGHLLLTGLALSTGLLVAQAHRLTALRWSPLVWIGKRSYGFYVWHFMAVLFVQSLDLSIWFTAPLALIFSLVAADISWRLIERPWLGSGHNLDAARRLTVACGIVERPERKLQEPTIVGRHDSLTDRVGLFDQIPKDVTGKPGRTAVMNDA